MASIYGDILTAVITLVEAAVPEGVTAVIRKKPIRFEGDTLPIVVIVPTGDKIIDEQSEDTVFIEYGVLVTIIYAGNGAFETVLDPVLALRQTLRKLLHITTLAAVPTVFDSDIDLNPAFDAAALDRNYDYSSFLALYRSEESRVT